MTNFAAVTRRGLFRAPESQVRAYELHLSGLSYQDIAAQLGITELTASEYVSRVRGVLGISVNGAKLPPADGFGAQLRIARQHKRLSQEALADVLRCSHATISRLESGARHPTAELVRQIASVLAPSPREAARLMCLAGYMPDGLAVDDVVGLVRGD